MSLVNPRDEYEALSNMADRFAGRFPTVPNDVVLNLIAEEVAGLSKVRFRTYVPLLVEGRVLRRLRTFASTSSAAHDLAS